jgi:hypothetical protein
LHKLKKAYRIIAAWQPVRQTKQIWSTVEERSRTYCGSFETSGLTGRPDSA